MGRIGVVIVTYASDAVLAGLLESLDEHEPDATLVIVDDACPAGPPLAPGREIVVLAENRGYGAACNRGLALLLRQEEIDYVAFLHPDMRLRGPSLTEMAAQLDSRGKVGIATGPVTTPSGERLPSAWGPTSIRRALVFAAGYEPSRLRAAAGTTVRSRLSTSDVSTVVDDLRVEGHVQGGTMFARVACLQEVGGFDEEFFLYWEDADLCHRARAAGWEVRLVPCTPFVNVTDAGTSSVSEEERWTWFVAGAMRFGKKHLVPGQAKQLEAALTLGRRLGRLRERG